MEQLKIPMGYHADLNLHDTQVAIKTVKDFFQQTLAQKLNLLRVSAPIFVDPSSGLNDNLNGVERPVSFDIKGMEGKCRNRTFPRKVETLCTETLWICTPGRPIHRYDCHPPR